MIKIKRKTIQASGMFCALLASFCIWYSTPSLKPEHHANTEKLQANEIVRASSLTMERRFGDIQCAFAIDRVTLQQKRVRFLSIGGSRELVVTGLNLRVEIPPETDIPTYNPFHEIDKMGLSKEDKWVGEVVSIHGISMNIYFGNNVISIVGKRAVFNMKKNIVHIEDGVWKRNNTVLLTGTFAVPAFLNKVVLYPSPS